MATVSSCGLSSRPAAVQGEMVFPEREWASVSPASQGLDSGKFTAALDYLAASLQSYGGIGTLCVARYGYLVYEGPESEQQHQIYSATKSVTSALLGVLIDDGTITLEARAHNYAPDLKAQYGEVTLRHFATMTSGYDATIVAYDFDPQGRGDSWDPGPPGRPLFPPGTRFRYWDEAMMKFGEVVESIAGERLDLVFRRRIADPIGMKAWRWAPLKLADMEMLNWTAGLHLSSKEMCRFGHLFLNRGQWNGRQLLSASWVDQATSVQVPPSVPNDPMPRSQGAGVYGFNWWVNGIKPDGQRLWPGAPPRTFFAHGYHGNVCIVVPEWKMVISRTNMGKEEGVANSPPDTDAIWSGFFARLGAAVLPD